MINERCRCLETWLGRSAQHGPYTASHVELQAMRKARAFHALGILLVFSALIADGPALLRGAREAWRLRRLSRNARREDLFPRLFATIHRIERDLPSSETVPVMMRTPGDVDGGVFLTYYLYPRPTKYFWTLDQYRFEAHRPPEALIAYADLSRTDAARMMTYAEIRDEQVRDTPPLAEPLSESASRNFIVPFVAAVDGAPDGEYMTQLDFLATGDGSLSLTLEPSGKRASIPLHARERVVLRDVVYEQFGALTSGWLRVNATIPVRAGAWLINRARAKHVAVPLFSEVPEAPGRVAAGDRLWLLNTEDSVAGVVVNGRHAEIPARGLISFESARTTNEIAGPPHILAFTSRKLPDGNTRFEWPGER